ncbi:glutathione gamma-glutamylcysteinyltransferase 1 [Hordeum vulgare]|nr:glutathione gamma-glutamylcysteinyltransferase 1 [Hordeum vulgare]
MEGFFNLISYIQTQSEPAFCSLASLSVVLNMLAIIPGRLWKGPWRLSCGTRDGKGHGNQKANDVCKDGKREMINVEDVFKALDEIEFPEFVDPLRTALEGEVQSQV